MTTVTILAWLGVGALGALLVADHLAAGNGDELLVRVRRWRHARRAGVPQHAGARAHDRRESLHALTRQTQDAHHAWPARFRETLAGPRLRLTSDDGRRVTLRLYHPDGVDRLARAGQLFVTSLRWRPSTGWEAQVDGLGGSTVCWAWFADVQEPVAA